jgi:hypothetical protein
VLCIASAHARQQEHFNERLAYARLAAAQKLPNVTHAQCFSAQGDWLERDKAEKQNDLYLFQRVSTEELARMVSLSSACAAEGVEGHAARPDATAIGAFVARSSEFRAELFCCAENFLKESLAHRRISLAAVSFPGSHLYPRT